MDPHFGISRPFLLIIGVFVLSHSVSLIAEESEPKTGWSVGGVPAISYESDRGFEYGLILGLHNFGDGERYPNYYHKIHLGWSRYTGGSSINEVFFDAPDFLFNKLRFTAYLGYLTELLQPFYGFNGYAARYEPAYETSDPADADYERGLYKSRAYYAHDRRMWKITTDVQGDLSGEKLRWIAGVGTFKIDVGPPDVEKLYHRLHMDEQPPDSSLYEDMVRSGQIPADEAKGGLSNYFKSGVVYDTRDSEANPMSGLWTEAFLTTFTSLLGSDYQFTLATVQHRQYFPLIENDLSFSYRLGYQGNLTGETPFFMLPFLFGSFRIREGLGGKWTLRGVLRNRVVGQSMGFANFEFRWKVYRTVLFNQNLYFAVTTFFDTGRVLSASEDNFHNSFGAGVYGALNENFIVGLDYGRAVDPRDGQQGIYIHLDFIY